LPSAESNRAIFFSSSQIVRVKYHRILYAGNDDNIKVIIVFLVKIPPSPLYIKGGKANSCSTPLSPFPETSSGQVLKGELKGDFKNKLFKLSTQNSEEPFSFDYRLVDLLTFSA